MNADNSDFVDKKREENRQGATGKYQGFYDRVMQKKREAQEAMYDGSDRMIDLDAELQKLERIKEMRRSKLDEHREKLNAQKLQQLTKIYFQNERNMLKSQ